MRRSSVFVLLIVAACGGTQIPAHNGYKSAKYKPWKKAKTLKFDDKNEAEAEGSLSYPDQRRAQWYVANLSQPGQLDLKLEVTPPGDEVNDEFDLGFEILDPGFRTIARSDLEEGDDYGEILKEKKLLDLEPGKYYVHLYLQGRLDTADYLLRATFQPMSSVGKSDFPAQVPFPDPLPMVPLKDDTPKSYRPAPEPKVVVRRSRKRKPVVKTEAAPPPAEVLSARIIGMQVVGGGTQITIGRGTSAGAATGMRGKINGVPNGSFTLGSCTERTCTATVGATPDQIKGSGTVTLSR